MAVFSSVYAEIAFSDHVDHLFRAKRGTIPSEVEHEFDQNTHRDNQVQIISHWEFYLRVTVI